MGDAGEPRDQPAHGVVRACRSARGRGDDYSGPLPVRHVTVYHSSDCGLCARALEIVQGVRDSVAFDLEIVDIGGNAELERLYRELLPVVEIDGEQAFTYFVDGEALRSRLEA
jgi:glutaredoxin